MGNISNWRQEKHPDFLLIGNSIVLGGNPINHDDKLGPLLEKELGAGSTVWSVAAGGWTNVNEMVYLDRNPDVLQNADCRIYGRRPCRSKSVAGLLCFSGPQAWLLTSYIFRKYVLGAFLGSQPVILVPCCDRC
jgi:hypothetical protein